MLRDPSKRSSAAASPTARLARLEHARVDTAGANWSPALPAQLAESLAALGAEHDHRTRSARRQLHNGVTPPDRAALEPNPRAATDGSIATAPVRP